MSHELYNLLMSVYVSARSLKNKGGRSFQQYKLDVSPHVCKFDHREGTRKWNEDNLPVDKRWTVLGQVCLCSRRLGFLLQYQISTGLFGGIGRTWKEVRQIPSAAAFGVACSCSSSFPCVDDSGAIAPLRMSTGWTRLLL